MKLINYFSSFFTKKIEFSINKRELTKYLPKNPIIVEAGICDGTDTEEFAQIFPSAKIHGFECLPYYYEQAKDRLNKYSNVTVYPFALNNNSGELDFYVSTLEGKFYGSGSLLAPKLHQKVHPKIKFDSRITVQSVSLDDWATTYSIERIDFLWLDLQGAEMKVLQGAERMLENVKCIFTEVSLIETYENVPLYDEVKSFLISKGFKIDKEYLPYRDMGNVLFIK